MRTLITYRSLILDPDPKFHAAMKYAIDRTFMDKDSVEISLHMLENKSQLNLINESGTWDLLIIDSSFINDGLVIILNEIYRNNPSCRLILLITNNEGVNIKETIRTIDTLDTVIDIEFILGGNITDNMKVEQCMSFISQDLK
jgi:DNA-binding NarL/FixJ family response regulator